MEKNMKKIKSKNIVHYDFASDVFYMGIKQGKEEECVEIAPGVSVEIDEQGGVIGIEILNASKVFKPISNSLQRKASHVHHEHVFSV